MSDFGDIRSAIHAQDMHALHDAMRQYRDPSTPVDVVAEYAIDAALKYEWSLPLMYGDYHWHPLDIEEYKKKMTCSVMVGYNGYKLGDFPTNEMRRWLLEWVVKPIRMWCVDELTHHAWDRVEAFHIQHLDDEVTGISGLWSPTSWAFSRAYGDDHQYAHVVHSVSTNNPYRVCGSLGQAMNFHNEKPWKTKPLLRDSLDLWALRYFLNPTS